MLMDLHTLMPFAEEVKQQLVVVLLGHPHKPSCSGQNSKPLARSTCELPANSRAGELLPDISQDR